jgi:hypothetical protein
LRKRVFLSKFREKGHNGPTTHPARRARPDSSRATGELNDLDTLKPSPLATSRAPQDSRGPHMDDGQDDIYDRQ